MNMFNFSQKLVSLVPNSIIETMVKIKVGNMKPDPVVVKSVLKRDDFMSLIILINIVLEKVIRDMRIETKEEITILDFYVSLHMHT